MNDFSKVGRHSRGCNQRIKPFYFERIPGGGQLCSHGPFERTKGVVGRRGSLKELIDQSDCSELQTFCVKELIPVACHEFNRASADIDRQGRLICQGDAVLHSEENQSSLFSFAYHSDLELRVFGYKIDEIASVLGFLNRARCYTDDPIKSLVSGQSHQVADHIKCALHGVFREMSCCEGSVSEPGHVF